MGLKETEAIVLRTYNLSEADKIVVCLTRELGVTRGVAKGARRLKSKFGASLEPHTFVNLSLYENENRELLSIRQADILRSHFAHARQAEDHEAMDYLASLVVDFSPPNEPNEKLYRLHKSCIETLASSETQAEGVVRYFEFWVLKISGFLPDWRKCASCRTPLQQENVRLFLLDRALLCVSCSGGRGSQVSRDAYAHVARAMSVGPCAWASSYATTGMEIRGELARITRALITQALERMPSGLRAGRIKRLPPAAGQPPRRGTTDER